MRIVRSIRIERLLGWLTIAFGGAALSLACLGLFGTSRTQSSAGPRNWESASPSAPIVAPSNGSSCGKHSCWSCWEERWPATRLPRRPRAPRSVLWHRAIRFRLVRDGRWRADCCVCVRRIHPGVARFAARSNRGATGRVIVLRERKGLVRPRKDRRAGRLGSHVFCSHSL